jgi:hypothetical protein
MQLPSCMEGGVPRAALEVVTDSTSVVSKISVAKEKFIAILTARDLKETGSLMCPYVFLERGKNVQRPL